MGSHGIHRDYTRLHEITRDYERLGRVEEMSERMKKITDASSIFLLVTVFNVVVVVVRARENGRPEWRPLCGPCLAGYIGPYSQNIFNC